MTCRTQFLRFAALALALAACQRSDAPPAASADSAAAPPPTATDSFTVAGFSTPESVLHDEVADVYLVSNINGNPVGKDDNGFISKVAPDGTVQQLKWIDGAMPNVTLHAPKGMAIIGDTLFVADIDSVRAFSRMDGGPLGARGVPGSTFLNDLAAGNGVLYVSDSGLKPDFSSSGSDAVYRFEGNRAVALLRDTMLARPNGLAVGPNGIIVVPFGAKTAWLIPTTGGSKTVAATLPAGQLDGVVRQSDGSIIVSSWESNTVYHVTPQGEVHAIMPNMESPADIGLDAKRNRVLIPLFNPNRVEIRGLH